MIKFEVEQIEDHKLRITTPSTIYIVKGSNYAGGSYGLWYEGDETNEDLIIIREWTWDDIVKQAMLAALHG